VTVANAFDLLQDDDEGDPDAEVADTSEVTASAGLLFMGSASRQPVVVDDFEQVLDDHLRIMKAKLEEAFPATSGAVAASASPSVVASSASSGYGEKPSEKERAPLATSCAAAAPLASPRREASSASSGCGERVSEKERWASCSVSSLGQPLARSRTSSPPQSSSQRRNARKRQARRPGSGRAPEAAEMSSSAAAVAGDIKVGDLVAGPFGQGRCTYLVPTGPNAGYFEVDGEGHCEVFPPDLLRRVEHDRDVRGRPLG
jgi:hypothetical protein